MSKEEKTNAFIKIIEDCKAKYGNRIDVFTLECMIKAYELGVNDSKSYGK